jgi:hypothetical protein
MIPAINTMSVAAVDAVRTLELANLKREQTPIVTYHLIHGGMYARTITIPAGVLLTGALIKKATTLVINGDVTVANGDDQARLTGYHVLPASKHRKQAWLAHADTQVTMLFPTAAQDILTVEDEFTDEAELLFSRHGANVINITGE